MLGLFSLEKRRFKGRSYLCVKMLDRRHKEDGGTLLSAAQWQGKRKWAQAEIHEIPFKHDNYFFFTVRLIKDWEQLFQRGC